MDEWTDEGTIGSKIKKYRKSANLSQRKLGNKIGMSQQQIAQYESGKRIPKMETISKIAKALNVNTVEFLDSDTVISITKDMLKKSNTYEAVISEAEEPVKITQHKDIHENPQQARLITAFDCLNDVGKETAIERIEELTKITDYVLDSTIVELKNIKNNKDYINRLQAYSDAFKQKHNKDDNPD